MPKIYVSALAVAFLLNASACGVAEESQITKLKISSSSINENDVPIVYDDSQPFNIAWTTPIQGGHSVVVSLSNSENNPEKDAHIIVKQCTQHGSSVCQLDAAIECALNSDWILNCEDEEYTLDISDQLLADSKETFIHLQICNLFNNRCSRRFRRIIVVAET